MLQPPGMLESSLQVTSFPSALLAQRYSNLSWHRNHLENLLKWFLSCNPGDFAVVDLGWHLRLCLFNKLLGTAGPWMALGVVFPSLFFGMFGQGTLAALSHSWRLCGIHTLSHTLSLSLPSAQLWAPRGPLTTRSCDPHT